VTLHKNLKPNIMPWSEVYQLIQGLTKDQLISSSRKILQIPPYLCKSKRYNYGEKGFEVKIGKSSKIKIPISMLKSAYEEAVKNNTNYNRKVFNKLYPLQCKDHGCHVHVIGQIFLSAGVAELIDKNSYKLTA